MKKTVSIFAAIVAIAALTLTGCKGAPSSQSQTYDEGSITEIHIVAGATDVNIAGSDQYQGVHYSIDGFEGSPAEQDGNKLTITLPMPDAGINFGAPEPLYISIPKDGCAIVIVESEVGNVSIANADINELSVQSQYGDITTEGISGCGRVESKMEELAIELETSGIAQNENGVGSYVDGYVGADDETHTIDLYTGAGTIKMK